MYEKSSKRNFAMAEYNLAHMKEKNNSMQEAIDYYEKASEDEDVPLTIFGHEHYDKRLEISKTFIICFTNLKISLYYFSIAHLEKSKKYFTKAFSKLINSKDYPEYQFKLKIVKEENNCLYTFIKYFILNFPSFNLINQQNLNDDIKDSIKKGKDYLEKESKKFTNQTKSKENEKVNKCKNILKINSNGDDFLEKINNGEIIIENTDDLFDFIISHKGTKDIFIKKIQNIIKIMFNIIYMPPFPILFGRINIEKSKHIIETNENLTDINYQFYLGFIFE